MNKISVTILTKDSEKYLTEALSSLAHFDEIIIFDTGSSDNTLNIAKQFSNVKILQSQFEGFGKTHNNASNAATHDWILSIDSDEIMTPELAQEITNTPLNHDCAYSFPRKNYYNGKWIKGCGWHPDRQIRLYNRTRTRFSDAHVHESVISSHLNHISLKYPVKHYSYDSISAFLTKMQSYSQLFAEQNKGKKHSSLAKAISHGLFAFFKSYFLKRGVFDGKEGLIISVYNAQTAFYKYLKLLEMTNLEKEGE